MNTLNALTGFSPFVLKMGCLPRLLPPLLRNGGNKKEMEEELDACKLILEIEGNVWSAKDSLLMSKVFQAHYVNKNRSSESCFQVGDQVMLMIARQRHKFIQAKDRQVAKFMARYDGPYKILESYPDSSTYKLQLPNSSNQFSVFHVSQLHPHHENDLELFPSCKLK
jgi:hypothetical protein